MKYLSYCIISRFEQEKIIEWHTVTVVEDGKKVENKQGVRLSIEPFLKRRHFYHDDPNPNHPT